MRTINKFALVSMLALGLSILFASCEKVDPEPETTDPKLNLDKLELIVDASGGAQSVAYSIENPVKDAKVEASSGDAWIKDIKVTDKAITFNVEASKVKEARQAKIAVKYSTISKELVVKQNAYDPAAPEITFTPAEITAEAAGGNLKVAYSIKNPVEGAKVEATCADSWVKSIKVTDKEISFTVEATTLTEERSTTIAVKYADLNKNIAVKQKAKGEEPAGLTFDVEFTEITATTAVFDVTPSDLEETYVMLSITKEYAEELGSDDAIIEAINQMISGSAENYGMSISEFLKAAKLLDKGTVEGVLFEDFKPNSENYILFLGMDSEGEVTSDLQKEIFTTKDVQKVDVTFEITNTITGPDVLMQVKPSKADVPYFFDAIEKAALDEAGISIEDAAAQVIKGQIDFGAMFGMSAEEVLADLLSTGDDEYDYKDVFKAETEYITYAVAVDPKSGILVSDATTKNITTGSVAPSDNVITLVDVTASVDRVTFSTTATNEDAYVVSYIKQSDASGKSDAEIMSYLIDNKQISKALKGAQNGLLFKGLDGNEDYYLVAFGFKAGVANTALVKEEFSTLEAGDPSKFTYTAEVSGITAKEALLKITPDPATVLYYFDIAAEDATAESIKEAIQAGIDEYIEWGIIENALQYWQEVGSRGPDQYHYKSLNAETTYKVYAVSINEADGSYATDIMFSETFTTKAAEVSTATIKVDHPKVFDADAIAEAHEGYDDFAGQGLYCMPSTVVTTGDVETTYQVIFSGDLTDTEKYSDDQLIYNLVDLGKGKTIPEVHWFLPYDTDLTIVAVAKDVNGNFTVVFREKVNYAKEDVSPVDEYTPVSAPAKVKSNILQARMFKSEKISSANITSVEVKNYVEVQMVAPEKNTIKMMRTVEKSNNTVKENKAKFNLRVR